MRCSPIGAAECEIRARAHLQGEPGAWYAMLPLEMCYAYEPVPPEPPAEEEVAPPPPLPPPPAFAPPLASAGSTPAQLPEVALVDSAVFEAAAAAAAEAPVQGDGGPAPMSPHGTPGGSGSGSDHSMRDSQDSAASLTSTSGAPPPPPPPPPHPPPHPSGISSKHDQARVLSDRSRRFAKRQKQQSTAPAGVAERGGGESHGATEDGGESELAGEAPPLMAADADWVLTRDEGRLILGAQANLWTEYVPDEGGALLPPAATHAICAHWCT